MVEMASTSIKSNVSIELSTPIESNTAESVFGAPARPGGGRVSRWVWAAFGFVALGVSMVGVALPFIPTTPFLLVAAFCFARSSERLNAWFKSTKLYRRVLESYVRKRSMTLKAKLAILIPVTILLGIGFALMSNVPVGCIAVAVVWACHVVYFGFMVKTDKGE